ncbi:MAG: serine/threonine protein kinase [Planctomycetes bacterium]|nr:serine/threonine protein kinase [Planctomycetota bacterium]
MDPRPADSTSEPAPPLSATGVSRSEGDTAPHAPTGPTDRTPHAFLSPPQRGDELGRLGAYRVLAELGRGGMGVVFRAEDTHLKRLVALKVMLPDVAADARAKARFQREAQAQAQVEHENVAVIHQVGEANGVPFIAMPLLKGLTLGAALKQNPRPPVGELVRIAREMAEGLAAAHAAGLVHRDIKPGNVWLDGPKRRVRILDFGLARATASGPSEDSEQLTARGAILGTPAYMSPEQAKGEPVDHRSDLFSLGVVLYQMATGNVPFTGASTFAVLLAVTEHHPPAAHVAAPDVPQPVSDLIGRLMAKSPDARPQTAQAVAAELEAIESALSMPRVQVIALPSFAEPTGPDPWADIDLTEPSESEPEEEDATEPPTAPKSRRRLLWAGFGLVVLTCAAVLAVLFGGGSRGKLVVEADDPTWEVVVKRDGRVVRDRTRDREFVLPPGEYAVEPVNPPPGLNLHPPRVKLGKNGRESVRLWVPKTLPPVVKPPEKVAPPPPDANRERAAAQRLNPHVGLGLRLASGNEASVQRGDRLPDEPFVVLRVYIQPGTGQVNDFITTDLLPALALAGGVESITDPSGELQWTAAELARLAGTPVRGTLTAFDANGPLNAEAVAALRQFPKLDSLQISAAASGDEDVERLKELPALRFLSLYGLGDRGPVSERKWAAIAALPLTGLMLKSNTAIDRRGGELLAAMPDLQGLYLFSVRPDPDALRAIGKAGRLTNLLLWYSPPTGPDGYAPLGAFGVRTEVKVSDGNVGDDALERFAGCTNLRGLDLRESKVTKEGAERLAARLPLCKILWPGGVIDPKVSPDRRAAEWLLPDCQLIALRLPDGRTLDVKPGQPLPDGPFLVFRIYLMKKLPAGSSRAVLDLLRSLSALREVKDYTYHIAPSAADLEQLAAGPCAKTLDSLWLRIELTPETLTALKPFPKLSNLHLSAGPADDALLARLKELPKLERLGLHDLGRAEKITEKGLTSVAQLPLRKLEFVQLPRFDRRLARLVAAMPKLEALTLKDGAVEAGALAELGGSPALTELWITDSALTDERLAEVARVRGLNLLNVQRTKVTRASVEKPG